MSRIHDHLQSQDSHSKLVNATLDDQFRPFIAKGAERDHKKHLETLEIQGRIHQAAIESAHVRAAQEVQLAEEIAVQLEKEARLEVLARERVMAEQAERTALAARIEAERQMVTQLELRFEQEKLESAHAAQRAAQVEQLRQITAERERQESLLQAEEQSAQASLYQKAIAEARKRTADEIKQAELYAQQQQREMQLEMLARERANCEQEERVTIAARVEAERALAAQTEARAEQEKLVRSQIIRKAAHEEQLRLATAAREAQERQLKIEELTTQNCAQEAAIAEARKRVGEEALRTKELAALTAEEKRAETLARERARVEQSERVTLENRIEAERLLTEQIELRIEQEKYKHEQVALRAAKEDRLRLAIAEREVHAAALKNEEQALSSQRKRTGNSAPRSNNARSASPVTLLKPIDFGPYQRFFGIATILLLVIGAFVFQAGKQSDVTHSLNVSKGTEVHQQELPTVASNGASQQSEAEIRQMVEHWAEAWSRRDAAAYLSYYSANFELPEEMQREEWEAQRQLRLGKFRLIEVTLKRIEINYTGGNTATVRFIQDFQADGYKELGTEKVLTLENHKGSWLIVSEKNI
jgi:ketosteroid isomerase-like protein